MAARDRRTVWPGSEPDDLSLSVKNHNHPSQIPVPFGRGTPTGDEGSSQGKGRTGEFVSRSGPFQDSNPHVTKGTNRRPPTASFSSPISAKRNSDDTSNHLLAGPSGIDTDELVPSQKLRSGHRNEISPRPSYNEVMNLDQAGLAVIGCDNTEEHKLVAIKRLKGINRVSKHLMPPFTSDQVVSVQDMFLDNDDLVIVYEHMHVSLRQVTGILQGPLKDFQIAAICKELVGGLTYIHDELSLCHGNLSCSEVILNLDGMVKIANIGESFAQRKDATADSKRKDIQSIGLIMMELMEPTTYILNPYSTDLQYPDQWRDGSGIKDFLRATQHLSLAHLKDHDFLPKKRLAKCLKAHVFCALWAVETNWDILSLP